MQMPDTLDHAIELVRSRISPEDYDRVREMTLREFMSHTHHSLGRFLRNEWKLWFNDTELTRYFSSLGINHGDDRSSIILESVYRTIHGDPVELESQVEKHKAFWKKEGFADGVHPPTDS